MFCKGLRPLIASVLVHNMNVRGAIIWQIYEPNFKIWSIFLTISSLAKYIGMIPYSFTVTRYDTL
ncbi:hypothetical protein RYX36_028859 [Vicia faba]